MHNRVIFLHLCLAVGVLALITRAQAAYFTDVPDSEAASQYITDVAYHQLMEGFPDGKFHPDAPLRRAESVMVLARLLNTALKGFMVLPAPENAQPAIVLPDAHWMSSAAHFLLEHGMFTSPASATYHANDRVTKGEYAADLSHLLHAGADITPRAAMRELIDESLAPPEWQQQLDVPMTRREVAQLLENTLSYLRQHAVAEGAITQLATDEEGFRWATLDTAIGECRLCVPTRGVIVHGATPDEIRVGLRIRTVSDTIGSAGKRGRYYCAREITVLGSAKAVVSTPQDENNRQ